MLIKINGKPNPNKLIFIIFKFGSEGTRIYPDRIEFQKGHYKKFWIKSIQVLRELPNECTQLIQDMFDDWLAEKKENAPANTNN